MNTQSGSLKDCPLRPEYDGFDDKSIARNTLYAMIPQTLPAIDGIDMASLYLPCDEIGGDMFDVIRISDELLAFVIFDVSCRGVSAALIASVAKIQFGHHMRLANSPRIVIDRVNAGMTAYLSARTFLTAFVGYLDLHSNRLTYCNAGHSHQLVYRKNTGNTVSLASSGTVLGVGERNVYDEDSVYLNPGDWVVVHTNGLYALFDNTDECCGRRRFVGEIGGILDNVTPLEAVERLRMRYTALPETSRPEDDISVIAIAVLAESRLYKVKSQLGFECDDPVYLQHVSYFEEMDRATAAILKAMDNQGYADDTIRKMKITLTELLVNALDHGNNRDPSKKVIIGHMVDSYRTIVSVMDEGCGFDPSMIPDPTLPENLVKDSGRGLFIVRCYVNDLRFNENGNRVTIVKNFD